MDIINAISIVLLGIGIFYLGQAYALIRLTREENQRHIETMARIRENRG